MKAINKQSIVQTIVVLFAAIIFQNCSSSNEKYSNFTANESVKTVANTNDSELSQEELEQAAALLLLVAVASEMDNSSDETYYEENSSSYDNDRPQLDIHDMIESNLANNIVYE